MRSSGTVLCRTRISVQLGADLVDSTSYAAQSHPGEFTGYPTMAGGMDSRWGCRSSYSTSARVSRTCSATDHTASENSRECPDDENGVLRPCPRAAEEACNCRVLTGQNSPAPFPCTGIETCYDSSGSKAVNRRHRRSSHQVPNRRCGSESSCLFDNDSSV